MSYSSRASSGGGLGAGLAVAGLFALIVAALRGNRFARIALAAVSVGFLILWCSSRSPRRNSSPTQSAAINETISTSLQWNTNSGTPGLTKASGKGS
jgi:apolipoprotein N-acyltransferase